MDEPQWKKPQWLLDFEAQMLAAYQSGSPALRPLNEASWRDPDFVEMETLVGQLVQFGAPTGVLDEECFLCRTRRLFRLLVAFHRTHSGGQLLDLDEDEVLLLTDGFIDGYFSRHHSGVVELAELFSATNLWLAQCAEHGFPHPVPEN